jgi:hypothetical protein
MQMDYDYTLDCQESWSEKEPLPRLVHCFPLNESLRKPEPIVPEMLRSKEALIAESLK